MNELLRRLSVLLRRGRFERELEEEMRFHLEMQAESNRQRGLDETESGYAAMRQFGNPGFLKESSWETWGWGPVERAGQDLRFAFRMMRKNPGFSAVVIAVLALGIGANTAIFSAVNAFLVNPFPFPEPWRLVSVDARHSSGQNSGAGYRDFVDWSEQNAVFEGIAIVDSWTTSTLTGMGDPQRINGGRTTSDFLRVLGVQPALGRFFAADEDRPSGPRVVVLSHSSWQQRFGGRPDILGRTMVLDNEAFTIIGVLPSRFFYPGIRTCEFWKPLQENPGASRYQHQYSVIARLKRDVALERAQADMTAIARRLEQQFPETNRGWGVVVIPLTQALAGETEEPVALLFSAVAFVLLLACTNIAGLLLARASGRSREVAIRASLGASRARIVRQMLTESALLSLIGGSLGVLLARWLIDILAAAAPEDSGFAGVLRIDATVLGFAFAVSVLTGMVFGIVPALQGSSADCSTALKCGSLSWGGARSRNRILAGLVVGEVALALVLLVGAGLLARDLLSALRLDTGVQVDHVLSFGLDLPHEKYSSPGRTLDFYSDLLQLLRRTPAVRSASAVATLPMTGGYSGGDIEIEGHPRPDDWMRMNAQDNICAPDYFRTMGIPLLRGRDFDERDTVASLRVTIINDTFARRYFPNDDPVGMRIKYQRSGWLTVIGVAGSVKHQQPTRSPVPMIYFPHSQSASGRMWVVISTSGSPTVLGAASREAVRSIDASLPVLHLRTMKEVVGDSLSGSRLLTAFLAGFAGFALALAAIGIYGLIAYVVSQRTREMGIRIALGALPSEVGLLVLRRGFLLALAGVALGLPAAFASSEMIRSMLYVIGPHDVTTYAVIPLVLLVVALLASYLPARRAARVDPAECLRHE